MEVLTKEPTRHTPKVVFDFNNNVFEISGDSRPENTHAFYQELIDWIYAFGDNAGQFGIGTSDNPVKFKFFFDYLNSSSNKFVLKLILALKEVREKGHNVVIDWCFEAPDLDMMELGEEYQAISETDINLVSIDI